MAAVRNKDTSIELRLRKALTEAGIRYFTGHGYSRLTKQSLPGRPDIVIPRSRLAVFCDGCFWHGCPKCYTEPINNRTFWRQKIEANKQRDKQVSMELEQAGWTVMRFWGHDLTKDNVHKSVAEIASWINAQANPKTGLD